MDRFARLAAAQVLLALLFAMAGGWARAAELLVAPAAGGEGTLPVEGFMELRGSLVVADDGTVSAHSLHRAGQVPADVRAFLDRQVAGWRVEFEDGFTPSADAVPYTVRVRASPSGDGLHVLWLDGVQLHETLPPAQRLRAPSRRRPEYPRTMGRMGASGKVYMLLLVDAEGRVEDVFAEQVDLTTLPADHGDAVRQQLDFIASAAAAVRHWRFRVPREGPYAVGQQAVRVPIVFAMRGQPMPGYGEWEFLVRGVRKSPPWLPDDRLAGDAMASADVQPFRTRMRVLTGTDGGDPGGQ
ncbi:MAG: hypothetical protein GX856_10235 [Gammaproteobacteria bacterium]|nr:hypothetical protein [Gammaproteobacteria bacterium]